MSIKQLEEYDYERLENYWFRFREFVAIDETNPIKKRNIDNIKNAIESLYNESEGLMRELIERGYFDAIAGKIDSQYMAKQLDITPSKLGNMRKGLMKETAELIGWV